MAILLKRLSAAASLIPKGGRVADIGCDHGRLAIFLRQNGIAKHVIATDLREKPLKNALKNIEKSKADGIEARLCDGFDGILPEEIDSAVIAGMGGVVIAGIIDRAPWIKEKRLPLVLQPMTSAEYLREYLCKNGFCIGDELTVEEENKVYTVMPAVYDGNKKEMSLTYYYAGKRDFSLPEAKLYVKKLHLRLLGEENAWQDKKAEYEALCRELYGLYKGDL